MGGGGLRLGGVGLLIVLAIGYFTGIDITPLLEGAGGQQTAPREISAEDEAAAEFTSRVLATTEEVWTGVFEAQLGETYVPPVLVLYSGVTQSPCGGASGATGPFYCPADRKAYLDTEFFGTLSRELGAREISPPPMSLPTRWRITSRTSWESCRRSTARGSRRARSRPTG